MREFPTVRIEASFDHIIINKKDQTIIEIKKPIRLLRNFSSVTISSDQIGDLWDEEERVLHFH